MIERLCASLIVVVFTLFVSTEILISVSRGRRVGYYFFLKPPVTNDIYRPIETPIMYIVKTRSTILFFFVYTTTTMSACVSLFVVVLIDRE